MRSNYILMTSDVEAQQTRVSLIRYTPTNSLKERLIDFWDYYFEPIKLYLFSYPMPEAVWNNREWRLIASGVPVIPQNPPEQVTDRLILISQRQPSD